MALSQRFFGGFPWRFILTTLGSETVTSLERLASNRTVTFALNKPAESKGQVPSWDPRVNIVDVEPGLDAPHLSFDDRLMFGFRREATSPDLWVVRFAGICQQIEDTAQTDTAISSYTAYDPWQYLFHRMVKTVGGDLIGTGGQSYTATRGDVIVEQLIENTIANDGDAYIELGGLEATAQIDINFQQGTSVGDALRQLVATGTLDVEFEPIYDPIVKPGICCAVNVYTQKGTTRNAAPFSWGVGRGVAGISNLLDGDQMANDIQFFNGQGGSPVTPSVDATSQGRYGVWAAQQFFPAQTVAAAVESYSDLQLDLRKQGRRSVTINPNPLLSPISFLDYDLGDRVPVYATTDLRQTIPWSNAPTVYQRVYGIPITLGDDGVETVRQLVASPDGFS